MKSILVQKDFKDILLLQIVLYEFETSTGIKRTVKADAGGL